MLFDVGYSSGAEFSDCKTYRYVLWREWEGGEGAVNFIMLNPSTADEVVNDPTVERCERRAREWGYSRLVVTNLFALRSTDPKNLRTHRDPIGPHNGGHTIEQASAAKLVIAAWGNHGNHLNRASHVRQMLNDHGIALSALRVAKTGQPCHPLYLPYSLKPIQFV